MSLSPLFLMCSCIVESRFCTIPPLVSRESSLSWVDYRVSCSKPLQSRSSSTSLPTWRAIPKEATGSCSPPPCLFPFSSRSFCPFSAPRRTSSSWAPPPSGWPLSGGTSPPSSSAPALHWTSRCRKARGDGLMRRCRRPVRDGSQTRRSCCSTAR